MSSITPAGSNGQSTTIQSTTIWPTVASFVVPTLSIIPSFPALIEKSARQMGRPNTLTLRQGIVAGSKAAPWVGGIIACQLTLEERVKARMPDAINSLPLGNATASAAVVAALTAPLIAIFNGKSTGLGMEEVIRKLSPKQYRLIICQEIPFVGGIQMGKRSSEEIMKITENKFAADFISGIIGGLVASLGGHRFNTELTCLQNGVEVKGFSAGASHRAAALVAFSLLNKLINENLVPKK